MNDLEQNVPNANVSTNVDNLVALINQLVKEQQYDGVALLFTSTSEAARNMLSLREGAGMQLLQEICLPNLNPVNYEQNNALYGCVEELLKVIAAEAPAEELLLELLELLEAEKSEHVFNSTLRALQVVLLRLADRKPLSLEWSLGAVHSHMEEMPIPEYLKEGYDGKQRRLLEQDEQIQSLLMDYITVGLFYGPIVENIMLKDTEKQKADLFRDESVNRRNIMACFLLQLLGKPLALLDLSLYQQDETIEQDNKCCNTYTAQCARQLTETITKCLGDPFYLLNLVEERVRWRRRHDPSKEYYEQTSKNMFLQEEKLPLYTVAIYFYMVFVENVGFETNVPKVYAPNFIYEAGLYLATSLLEQDELPLHYRALLLIQKLLDLIENAKVPAISLELALHKRFCDVLCNVVGYSSQIDHRQLGIILLRRYIVSFDDEGKYLVLKNLMRNITHNGIDGYLAIIYKDLVAEALNVECQSNNNINDSKTITPLPASFSGHDFRSIFLQQICRLPQGVETDFIENADKVISSLNALRFFAINDCHNRTGFWDFTTDLECKFLKPLRQGLDLSIAHYKAELLRVQNSHENEHENQKNHNHHKNALSLLDLNIANATSESGGYEGADMGHLLNREQKLNLLNQNLCTFDLMKSLLARTTECVENPPISIK